MCNMCNLKVNKRIIMKILFLIICIALYALSKFNYLLFHTAIELPSIIIGFSSLIIAIATSRISKSNHFYLLSIMLTFLGFIDLFHALTYKGMNIFTSDANMATQLWILGRFYELLMFYLLILGLGKSFNFIRDTVINAIGLILFLSTIIVFKVFPTCYIEGYGLTLFKKASEYVICLGYLIILVLLSKRPFPKLEERRASLIKSVLFKILMGLCFSIYVDIYGALNFLGHIFKSISYYYLIKIMVKDIVISPYTVIFKKLSNKINELEEANVRLQEASTKVESTEYLYNKFINFIPDGVIIIRNFKIEFVNKRFLKMLEVQDESLLINKDILTIVDEKYHSIIMYRITSKNANILENPQEYEFFYNHKKIWVEVTSLISIDERGEYLISTVRDIEDKKRSEEIEQLLQLRKKEDQMKSEFFSNISHELRTPINVIYSAMQLQKNFIDNYDMASMTKYNNITMKNCLRLLRLTNNLIDVTEIDTDFFKPNINIENIISLIEDTTHSIFEYVKSKKINILFDTELEEAYVSCDSVLIERIIFNLLSNSVKYSRANGNILVYIHQPSEDQISISIKDDGIGISEEIKARIFKKFFKGDTSLSRKAEGSGIGLYLVKRLVEIQKGKITFNSEINVGTEFIITFPLVDYVSEVCATSDKSPEVAKSIIKSIEMEFSDIYS